MKQLLIASFAVAIIASILVFANPNQANAVPVSYNVSSLSNIWTTFTRTNFTGFVETGYNGTANALYVATATNTTLNYEFGYHPTLPIALDTFNNITASASVAATQSISLTINSAHNNRVIVVGISFQHNGDTNHNNARMSTVKIGTSSFALMLNKTVTCGANACSSEIWVLNQTTPTGAQTITITPASVTTYHMVAGAYSFYNVRAMLPIGVTTGSTGTSVTPSVTLTPTFKGTSWLVDNIYSLQTISPTANSDTREWVGKTAAIIGASQIKQNPTISAGNSLTWTTNNVQWISSGVEMIPIQNQQNFAFNLAYIPQNSRMVVNGSNFYYPAVMPGGVGPHASVNHLDTNTGVETHDFTIGSPDGTACAVSTRTAAMFVTETTINGYCNSAAIGMTKTTVSGNTTISGVDQSTPIISSLKIRYPVISNTDRFNSNSSTSMTPFTGTANLCEINYQPSNTTTPIDNIACDISIPNHISRFWNGMYLTRNNNYYINSTLPFLTPTDNQIYKAPLTVPATIYNIPNPDVKIVGHWGGVDYLISISQAQIKYAPMSTVNAQFIGRALQSYDLTLVGTDSHFYLSPSSASPQVQIKLYGPILNTTISKFGMIMVPSGYTMRTTATSESIIRPLDPRWTNTPQNDYPAITTTGTQFPLLITVSNAPTDSSLMLTNPAQTINSINSVWCVTQLDSTRSAECDIPPNQCALVYVADISVTPTIFTYEGSVCAAGSNTKTLAYTNTLPLTFYTLRYGATHSYTPSTNALSVTTRSSTSPFTYNVLIKNSTGAITQNFTTTINGTIDTHNFNITNTTKPAGLFVSIPGTGTIYSAYIGSPLSFASTVSFFHQYLSYQGFDLLSFIPLIFAAMFTRNTVGIGTALVVVVIATLSFLSVVVVSDTVVIVSIFIAILGLVGYRSLSYG